MLKNEFRHAHNEQGLTFENPHPIFAFQQSQSLGAHVAALLCVYSQHSLLPNTAQDSRLVYNRPWASASEIDQKKTFWIMALNHSFLQGSLKVLGCSEQSLHSQHHATAVFQPSVEAGLKKEKGKSRGSTRRPTYRKELSAEAICWWRGERVLRRASYPKGLIWLESYQHFPGNGKEERWPWHPLGTVSGGWAREWPINMDEMSRD